VVRSEGAEFIPPSADLTSSTIQARLIKIIVSYLDQKISTRFAQNLPLDREKVFRSTATMDDIARFQINDSSLFQRTIEIVSGVLSQIDEPQVEISGDCNCIWCQQKISEIKEALSS